MRYSTKKSNKTKAKRALKGAAVITCSEDKLALGVVLKAVDDVGVQERENSCATNSIPDILQGGLNFWLEALDISSSYFFRVLEDCGVLSLKKEV